MFFFGQLWLNNLVCLFYFYSKDAMNCWTMSKTAFIWSTVNSLISLVEFHINIKHMEYSKPFPHPIQELQLLIGLSSFPYLIFPYSYQNCLFPNLSSIHHKNAAILFSITPVSEKGGLWIVQVTLSVLLIIPLTSVIILCVYLQPPSYNL